GHGRVLAPFCDLAAQHGWLAIAPDLPGYGLTRVSNDFDWSYDEWLAVVCALADEIEGPLILMGFSVGGLTAALAAQSARSVNGVLASTLLDLSDPFTFVRSARWPWLGYLSLVGFRMLPSIVDRIALPLRLIAPFAKMSSDAGMRSFFESDPLLGQLRVPSRLFRTMHARKLDAIAPGCPLWLIHPGADVWTPTDVSRSTFDRVRGAKRLLELTNGGHLPLEQPALSEFNDALGEFLRSVGSRAPPGSA
ncbi:MAG: alpha/beta fold hydrolase, partial [Myxococcota bacterium]